MTLVSNNSQIAVIGASSMVGSRFCEQWEDQTQLISVDLNSTPGIDLTNPDSISEFFQNQKFETAILFSAFTDVDAAELQRNDKEGLCWKINVEGTKNIVENCRQHNVKLVFISTDFVFDGQSGPYAETDPVGLELEKVSWYGITKIEGEKEVAVLENSLILRISYPYRGEFEAKEDFFKKIVSFYREGKLYPMFDDQIMTPTFVDDVAPALKLILGSGQNGTFHLASPTTGTPYDISKYLIETSGGDPGVVESGSLVEFLKGEGRTPRPVKGGLKVARIEKLGFVPTSWEKGIDMISKQSKGEHTK